MICGFEHRKLILYSTETWRSEDDSSDSNDDGVHLTQNICFQEGARSPFNGTMGFPSVGIESIGYIEGICNSTAQVCRGRLIANGGGDMILVLGANNVAYYSLFDGTWDQRVNKSNEFYYENFQPSDIILDLIPLDNVAPTTQQCAQGQYLIFNGKWKSSSSQIEDACGTDPVGNNDVSVFMQSSDGTVVRRGTYFWENRTLVGYEFLPGYASVDTVKWFSATLSSELFNWEEFTYFEGGD